MIDVSLLVVGLAYGSICIALTVGVLRATRRGLPVRSDHPFVSVIIPARNEELGLRACLVSALTQSYPADRFEVILVDDHSTDGTPAIARSMQALHKNLRIVVPKESSHLTGRSNALAYGIDTARGDILMMTDADCMVPPTWVEHTSKQFIVGVGVVGGMTVQRIERPLDGMQSVDWMFLLGIAAATVGLRLPLSIIGNNFSIARRAYDDVGGFRSIKNSITEDFQLFKAVVNTGRWEYRFMLDPAATNLTRACPNVHEIVEQKHRWGRGGLDLNWLGYALIITGFLMHLLLVVGGVTGAPSTWSWLLFKMAGDAMFLFIVATRVDRLRDLVYTPLFEVYYLLYVLLMPLRVFGSGEVEWKGRMYGADHRPIEGG